MLSRSSEQSVDRVSALSVIEENLVWRSESSGSTYGDAFLMSMNSKDPRPIFS